MKKSKTKIVNKLHEVRDKVAMQTAFDASMKDAEDVVKNTLGSDTPEEEVKDIAAQLATESNDSVGRGIEAGMNPEVEADKYEEYRALMAQLAAEEGGEQPVKEDGMLSESGNGTYNLTKGENVDNMMRDVISILGKYVGTHSTNNGAVANDNRVILYDLINSGKFKQSIEQMLPPSSMHYGASGSEYLSNNEPEMIRFMKSIGMNPEGKTFRPMPVREQVMNEEGEEGSNDPVKLKSDVAKLMGKLDISSIAPYLQKIDNPVEQAEVIGQFAEKIGVPKAKLSMVVAQLKIVAEAKMTKNKLIESVTGRKIVKTIKVKDIK